MEPETRIPFSGHIQLPNAVEFQGGRVSFTDSFIVASNATFPNTSTPVKPLWKKMRILKEFRTYHVLGAVTTAALFVFTSENGTIHCAMMLVADTSLELKGRDPNTSPDSIKSAKVLLLDVVHTPKSRKMCVRMYGLQEEPGLDYAASIGYLIKPDNDFNDPKLEFSLGTSTEKSGIPPLQGDKLYDFILGELRYPFSLKESKKCTNCVLFCFRLLALLSPTPTKRSAFFSLEKEHYTFDFSASAVFHPALPVAYHLDNVLLNNETGQHKWILDRKKLMQRKEIPIDDTIPGPNVTASSSNSNT